MKILWQSKSPVVSNSFSAGSLDDHANGGNAYDYFAAKALSSKLNIDVDSFSIRREKENILAYWRRMRRYKAPADILIMEPYPVVFGKRTSSQKSAGMIHHIDPALVKGHAAHRWYFKRLLSACKKLDLIITVSNYWKDYLLMEGCKNVEVIYNSFNPEDYRNKKDDRSFIKQLGLSPEKKIIYIGNASREKGVYEVYDALKNSGYQLVMSGPSNRAADLDVAYFKLNRNDYKKLLAVSSVVVTYSKMAEGWNRIAHEALLSGTPVVGSGSGGMKELLDGAGQICVNNDSLLLENVQQVISNPEMFSSRGYQYVKQFDEEYFKNKWLDVISKLSNGSAN